MKSPDSNDQRYFPEPEKDDLSSHAHRQLIGYVGAVLPLLLWVVTAWRPTPIVGQARWAPLGSISAYYYTGAVSVFAGCLIALALFLFSYRGYKNEYGRRDRIAAAVAGLAAVLVAFFPTEAPEGISLPDWWTELIGAIHYGAAIVLFASFVFFALVQFPRTSKNKTTLPADKRSRNRIYIFCGIAIILSLVWAIVALIYKAPIFWPETAALEFFAISWLVKGRAEQTLKAVGQQTWHYSRHPRQLLRQTAKVIRGR